MDFLVNVLYEDEDVLAINKPSGVMVHPASKNNRSSVSEDELTISEWFVKKYPDSKNVGESLGEVERPGIVHRLDKETSGVLLLAKTKRGHELLKSQFQNREVEKVYHAFLHGNLKEDHGTIKLKISRSKSDFRKKVVSREGREAVTHFRVLGRGDGTTFVEAKPKTGRTHQIRVHFRALHHPVVGDKLYASTKESILNFSRLALHARSISFLDLKGEKQVVEAPYPKDFKEALDTIGLGVVD